MATRGNWLTMTFLDRFVLFKPPLLMWLSGLSAKIFGISSLPLRLPSLLSGALICLLIARAIIRKPAFQETAAELKKDREWLRNLDETTIPPTT